MLLLFSPLSFLGTRNFSELTAVSKDQRKKEEISSSSAGSPRHFKQFYRGGKKKVKPPSRDCLHPLFSYFSTFARNIQHSGKFRHNQKTSGSLIIPGENRIPPLYYSGALRASVQT